jgi:diaminopimelate dehydrogenase
MTPLQLAIIGLGRLGTACARAALKDRAVALAGIVRRPESRSQPVPEELRAIPIASHIHELKDAQVALLCLPREMIQGTARDLLQHRIPCVDCAQFHGEAFQTHQQALHRYAVRHGVVSIVGAGWDPGALSLFRGLFALLTPSGHMEMTHRPGLTLHHTALPDNIPGVADALCTEVRTAEGNVQRYVYVEIQRGADPSVIAEAIRSDPVHIGVETLVFPVDNLARLEEEGHGVVIDRRGTAGSVGHQHLLIEARGNALALAAQIMLSAARAVPQMTRGSYALWEVPVSALWGDEWDNAVKEWI